MAVTITSVNASSKCQRVFVDTFIPFIVIMQILNAIFEQIWTDTDTRFVGTAPDMKSDIDLFKVMASGTDTDTRSNTDMSENLGYRQTLDARFRRSLDSRPIGQKAEIGSTLPYTDKQNSSNYRSHLDNLFHMDKLKIHIQPRYQLFVIIQKFNWQSYGRCKLCLLWNNLSNNLYLPVHILQHIQMFQSHNWLCKLHSDLGHCKKVHNGFVIEIYTYGHLDGSMKFSAWQVIRPNIGNNSENRILTNYDFGFHDENCPFI